MSGSGLREVLAKHREVQVTTVGRRTGKRFTIPINFVVEGRKILFIPTKGSDAQWYKNLRQKPRMTLSVEGRDVPLEAKLVDAKDRVDKAAGMLRSKYGDEEMKWYKKLDVCVEAELPE